MSKPIRCLQLCHGFVQQAADWIHQFCLHHPDLFPPFHCPFRLVVEISNPSLAMTTFNYKRWLAKWHPTPSFSCQCASLSGKTATGHTFARASDAWGLDDMYLDRWNVFLTQQWQLHRQQDLSSSEQQERRQLRRLVLLPADHAASRLHVAGPVHFERLLQSTFCDIFVRLMLSVYVCHNQVTQLLTTCARHNHGGFDRQLGGPFIGSDRYPMRASFLKKANTGTHRFIHSHLDFDIG